MPQGNRKNFRRTCRTFFDTPPAISYSITVLMPPDAEQRSDELTVRLTTRKKIAFALIALVLGLIGAELIARFVLGNYSAASLAERRDTFEPYQNKSWTEEYFRDEAECGRQRNEPSDTTPFVRYLLFDVGYPECRTPTANLIDGNKRKTWNPNLASASGTQKVYRIGIFGGSTVQGVGVPDDLTIPSQFSKLVNGSSTGALYEVENYGVSSYTYTQSVMKLVLLLREGIRFDYVVMYNGANDIDNAYDAGSAGAIHSEKTAINLLYGGLWGQAKEELKAQISLCALCRIVVTGSRNTPVLRDHITPYLVRLRRFVLFKEGGKKNSEGLDTFGREIADYYGKSHDLLDNLSRAYGFRYAEFWQPSLLYEDAPVGGEAIYWNIDNRLTDEKLKQLYRSTLDEVLAMKLDNFYDLSRSLVGRPKAYYIDAVHISDDGNREIAEQIFERIGDKLPR